MNRTKHIVLSLLALLCWLTAAADATVTKCEYWFDQQYGSRTTADVSEGSWNKDIDISALNYGLHSIAFRVLAEDGAKSLYSPVVVKNFIKLETTPEGSNSLKTYEYWIDQQFDKRTKGNVDASGIVNFDEDLSALNYGLHSVTIRVIDATGKVSSALVKNFMKLETTPEGSNSLKTYEYWIDQQFDKRTKGNVDASGIVSFDEDLSALNYGLHNITIRVIDATGKVSSALVKNFMIVERLDGENALQTYEYWIDNGEHQSANVPADGVVALDLDISTLSEGLHTFNYCVTDKAGHTSGVVFKNFMVKKIKGEGKLIAIDYWFNDEPRTRITIDPAQVSIDRDDITIPLDNLKPRGIAEDYVFDVTTKKITTKENVTVGIQVFNNEEIGSEAVVDTLKDYVFTFDPSLENLTNGKEDTEAAPQGGQVQVFSFEGAVGDSLHWEFSGSDAKIDFYDADGNRLTPETKTVDGKDVLVIKMPTTAVYALTYGATAAGEMTVKVSVELEFIPGDANSDKLVNVTDIVATVNYIMEKPSPGFNKKAADLNGDGEINVTDIVKMVSIIMSGDGGSSRRAAAASGNLVISGNNIQLRNAESYTAAQFDIFLSDGQSISDVALNGSSDHSLSWKMIDANTCRVVAYSMTNAAFRVNGDNLFSIIVNGGLEEAAIGNELLIQAEGVTGIDLRRQEENYDVYDLRGNKVRSNATDLKGLSKGIYIINGKKVVVK